MTTCTELSDRIPDVALGRSRWTVEEERHLAACADCRAEWTIVAAARRLGSTLPATPDPAVTTARLLERLASERARSRARGRVWAAAGLAAAAAVALAVWTGRGAGIRRLPESANPGAPAPVSTGPVPSAPAPPAPGGESPVVATQAPSGSLVEFPMPELDSLPAEALDSLLRVLDEPLANADADDTPLGDAGDEALERALAGLEG